MKLEVTIKITFISNVFTKRLESMLPMNLLTNVDNVVTKGEYGKLGVTILCGKFVITSIPEKIYNAEKRTSKNEDFRVDKDLCFTVSSLAEPKFLSNSIFFSASLDRVLMLSTDFGTIVVHLPSIGWATFVSELFIHEERLTIFMIPLAINSGSFLISLWNLSTLDMKGPANANKALGLAPNPYKTNVQSKERRYKADVTMI